MNQHIIQRAVEEGQGYALQAGEAAASAIPADVVSAPTEARLVNLSPQAPTVTSFFGPAVLALILQHLAVSLVAMSLARERSSGVMELFRISPVTAAEVLAGKVLAYGLLGFVVAGLTMVLLVNSSASRRSRTRGRWHWWSVCSCSPHSDSGCSSRSCPTPSARRSSYRC